MAFSARILIIAAMSSTTSSPRRVCTRLWTLCRRFALPVAKHLAVVLVPWAVLFQNAAQADSVVVFNEIMYHPATDEPALEWVELHNQNAVDVDLSDWRLT